VKRNIITLIGAVIIIGGVVLFNVKFAQRMDPSQAEAAETNVDTKTEVTEKDLGVYRVKFETSNGDFVVEVDPELSPLGAEQFKEMIQARIYDEARFYRVVPGFVVQWGIPGDPRVAAQWQNKNIQDEPVKASNVKGTITYAKSNAPNSRSNQVFINLGNNTNLDGMGFAPFGKVVEGMTVVEGFYSEFGDEPTSQQQTIVGHGNAFLEREFPGLDYIKTARIIGADGQAEDGHEHHHDHDHHEGHAH
jgi:peptidyl-prolyl cis-trans isomerase A (cyclophilin A)